MAGATLTLTQMLDETRQLYLDLDTVDQAFTDANLGKRINYWYHWWYATYSPQALTDTSALSYSSGNLSKTWTTADNPTLSITQVSATATGEGTNILQKLEVAEIRELQLRHVAGTATSTKESGLPTMYAIQPDEVATGGSAASLTHTVYVYPVPDATTTVTIVCRAAPDDLSAGGDQPRCDPFASRMICRAAAVDCAALTGDFDLSSALLRSLPQEMQAALATKSEFLKPNASQAGKTNA